MSFGAGMACGMGAGMGSGIAIGISSGKKTAREQIARHAADQGITLLGNDQKEISMDQFLDDALRDCAGGQSKYLIWMIVIGIILCIGLVAGFLYLMFGL